MPRFAKSRALLGDCFDAIVTAELAEPMATFATMGSFVSKFLE
jgi:hypothetical protein